MLAWKILLFYTVLYAIQVSPVNLILIFFFHTVELHTSIIIRRNYIYNVVLYRRMIVS